MTPFEEYCLSLYPEMLRGLTRKPHQSCLSSGFECGKGWHPILLSLFASLPPDTTIHQIKENFGGLRVYATTTKEGQAHIDRAEQCSYCICERCSTTENVSTQGPGRIRTLCDECRQKI